MDKPFDLKAAMKLEPILWDFSTFVFVTTMREDGRTLLRFQNTNGTPSSWLAVTLDGQTAYTGETVYMAPKKVKKTVYANLRLADGCDVSGSFEAWPSEAEARQWAKRGPYVLAAAVPVEIEVEE